MLAFVETATLRFASRYCVLDSTDSVDIDSTVITDALPSHEDEDGVRNNMLT
jgi:hypothetical protein